MSDDTEHPTPHDALFGAVPTDVERRVREATDDEIERWTERVLKATSLDDVLG